ncbi:hypothetical protein NMG60_11035393 [Bertholletia excelsa]
MWADVKALYLHLEMMRPSDSEKPPYAARVGKIEADHENNMKLLVRLYYRLVDSVGEQGNITLLPAESYT